MSAICKINLQAAYIIKQQTNTDQQNTIYNRLFLNPKFVLSVYKPKTKTKNEARNRLHDVKKKKKRIEFETY
jgi:hypothetical protein